jgi:hypothetical protein
VSDTGLSLLQRDVLQVLAAVRPPWTLTGGAALAGFHLLHRTTRDLDLFWHGRDTLAAEGDECRRLLEAAGLQVEVLQRTPAFLRLRAARSGDAVVVDLVAEPVANTRPPMALRLGEQTVQVDAPAEILANKLGCLLHRAELRDLIDIRALLATGLDLGAALAEAGRKDGGFSPLMVAHLLAGFPFARQATQLGLGDEQHHELDAFRQQLAERIAAHARP